MSVRLAVAQINTVVGDLAGNLAKVLAAVERSAPADLVVFPELALVGYPPKDLLYEPGLVTACEANLDALVCAVSGGPAVVVGTIDWPPDSPLPRNIAVLVHGGRVHRVVKRLLPTYDVFDEARYFVPGAADQPAVFDVGGIRVGVCTCEDMWNDAQLWGPRRRYEGDPVSDLAAAGAQLVVNVSASPFDAGKPEIRRRLASHAARRHGMAMVLCNLVGGNDSLVFDGGSLLVECDGTVAAMCALFEEDHTSAAWSETGGFSGVSEVARRRAQTRASRERPLVPPPCHVETEDGVVDDIESALILGLHDYMAKLGFDTAVVGLSGGIDSALTAYLAAQVVGGEQVLAVEMPSKYTSELSRTIGRDLIDRLQLTPEVIAIDSIQDVFLRELEPMFGERPEDATEENLQARIRGTLLMALSNKFGHLVLSTGNKSEMAVGYCTLYGDMNGGLAVISDLFKSQVFALCTRINARAGTDIIPRAVLERPPSAELRADQTDQDSLPPYAQLDPVLAGILEDRLPDGDIARRVGVAQDLVRQVRTMVDAAEFKRQQAAPTLRVSRRAWHGRRHPIVHRFP